MIIYDVLCGGAQWLSGRLLDSISKGGEFETHRQHCVVSLSKTHLSLLSTGKHSKTQIIIDPFYTI